MNIFSRDKDARLWMLNCYTVLVISYITYIYLLVIMYKKLNIFSEALINSYFLFLSVP